MTPLLRISSARAEHQTSTGVWALVLRAMRAYPGRIIVAQRLVGAGVATNRTDDGQQWAVRYLDADRIIYAAIRPTTARATA